MERAKVQLESAQIELEGTERLFQQGGASASAVARLRGAASAAKAQYELAKKAYEDCTVRAPISGVVAVQDPSITVGSFLSRGTRILRIVDTSSFRLELSVGEREVGELQGISEGDLVLVSGMSKLKSGSPVNPREVGDSLKWE
jgi:multidrug resistance efflux pump